mmetsp:Transcript_24444/g.66742  ORF Transcript_24444/g.66742 Transcript_24444/m.66742 type:complete len:238 (-) Transcript_24444:114-827(-)
MSRKSDSSEPSAPGNLNLILPPKHFGQRGSLPKAAPSAHFATSTALLPERLWSFALSRAFSFSPDQELKVCFNASNLARSFAEMAAFPLGEAVPKAGAAALMPLFACALAFAFAFGVASPLAAAVPRALAFALAATLAPAFAATGPLEVRARFAGGSPAVAEPARLAVGAGGAFWPAACEPPAARSRAATAASPGAARSEASVSRCAPVSPVDFRSEALERRAYCLAPALTAQSTCR